MLANTTMVQAVAAVVLAKMAELLQGAVMAAVALLCMSRFNMLVNVAKLENETEMTWKIRLFSRKGEIEQAARERPLTAEEITDWILITSVL